MIGEYIPIWVSAVATNSTTDIATLPVPFKAKVVRAFVLVTGASAHATSFVIKFDKRVKAGSDDGRGNGDVATISKTTLVDQQGKYLYEDPTTRVTVEEGDQIIVEVTTAQGEACAVDVGVLLERIPEIPGNNSSMVAA